MEGEEVFAIMGYAAGFLGLIDLGDLLFQVGGYLRLVGGDLFVQAANLFEDEASFMRGGIFAAEAITFGDGG